MKSQKVIFLVIFLAAGCYSLPIKDLERFCKQLPSDTVHADYLASKCNQFCTPHEKHLVGYIQSSEVCSFVLPDWCEGGACRNIDHPTLVTTNSLGFKNVKELNLTSNRNELCFVPANFSLEKTPLEDRSTCSVCSVKNVATAKEGEWNRNTVTCGDNSHVNYLLQNKILLETYSLKLSDPQEEVMFSASLYPFSYFPKPHQKLDFISFETDLNLTEVNSTVEVDLKEAFFIVYKDV